MDPARKRKVRLVVLLSAALVLATALIYTSFSAASPETTPSRLMARGEAGQSYKLGGKVVRGSVKRDGDVLRFAVADPKGAGGPTVPVVYRGTVPDPFRVGREVSVAGELRGGTFVAERDSLVTKCPSKFTKAEDKPQL